MITKTASLRTGVVNTFKNVHKVLVTVRSQALLTVFMLMLANSLWVASNFAPAASAQSTAYTTTRFSRSIIDLKFQDSAAISLQQGRFVDPGVGDIDTVNTLLDQAKAQKARLFTEPEATIKTRKTQLEARSGRALPNLNGYYRIALPARVDAEGLSASLRTVPIVDKAYPEPLPAPSPAAASPSFVGQQKYQTPAPSGMDTNYATNFAGGTGNKVKLADIEYSWNTAHEDLSKARLSGAFIPNGTPNDPFNDNNHGTAVLGLVAGDVNAYGINGTSPAVDLHFVNANNAERAWDVANSIAVAAQSMSAGDVILIDQQTWGPAPGQNNFVPVEWVPAIYDAIRVATAAGIIVVESAGNGNQNLDDAAYYGTTFPNGKPDSGAIIVGAGAACGTSPARSRLSFSTYGKRVNLQSWGECVTTTGYGDLYSSGTNALYTQTFGGTSSATPLVAAAAAAVSSAYKQANGTSASPAWVLNDLVNTGTPQDLTSLGALPGTIGPMPNLAQALPKTNLDMTNLSLGHPAKASSVEAIGLEAAKAFDGNASTRWSSAEGIDPQWIYVDLGATYAISHVTLSWETAYAKTYQIQVSNDATNWTTIYSTTSGKGGVNDLTGLGGTGRYVRMYGTARGTPWGYSLYEFGVYGKGAAPAADTTAPTAPANLTGTAVSSTQINLSWSASTDNVGVKNYEVFRGNALIAQPTTTNYSDNGLSANTAYSYSVKAIDAAGNLSAASNTALVATLAVPVTNTVNLAQGRPARASSIETAGLDASKAFDGSTATRWASAEGAGPQWIYVDLGASYAINRVKLSWEAAYAQTFQIQVSSDATNWTTIYSTATGTSGITNLTSLHGAGRYVRMYATVRGTPWGYSLWEFEVYGN